MDPVTALGLLQSVDVLVGMARCIVSNMYLYFEAVKNAPKMSAELRQEMGIICTLLDSLAIAAAHEDSNSQCRLASSISLATQQFKLVLSEMNTRVTVSQTSGMKRLKWPFAKEENERLLAKLERFKNTFTMAMSIKCV